MDGTLWLSAGHELASRVEGDPALAVADDAATKPAGFLDYAAYFDLTMVPPHLTQVPAEAKAAAAARLTSALCDAGPEGGAPVNAPRITNFSEDFFEPAELAAMSRWWDIEPSNRMSLVAASAQEFATVSALAEEALGRLASAAPDLHGETLAIVRDLVVAKPDETSLIRYSGASSFALWGAITVNAEIHHNWMQMYRQVVHEAGHNLLFGIAREEPLLLNEAGERTASPIRADPRPIDGVFHAAYVSAREAYALEALLIEHGRRGSLSENEAGIVEDLLRLSVLAFTDCVETLRSDAVRLTSFGSDVLGHCEDYVQSNFSVEPG